jgi:predicted ATP-dependent endonuclease of OLD family
MFRSIGNEGIEFPFSERLNIIMGENNTGKSNILVALTYIKNICGKKEIIFDINDYYNGIQTNEIELCVTIKLDNNEMDFLIENIIKTSNIIDNEEVQTFFRGGIINEFEIIVMKIMNEYNLIVRNGKLFNSSRGGTLKREFPPQDQLNTFHISSIINGLIKQNKRLDDNEYLKIGVGKSGYIHELSYIYNYITYLYRQNFNVFDDFRRKPVWKVSGALDSLNGQDSIRVLYNLYNHKDKKIQERYFSILKEFEQIFPNISFRAVEGDLHIQKDSLKEMSINLCGSGLIEMLTFLVNVIDVETKVFGLEEPELHFHPHLQRVMFDLIKSNAGNNQFIILSHSPYFIDSENIDNCMIVRDIDNKTQVFKLPDNYFQERELAKLKKIIDIQSRDLFFAKKVMLLEGETELGAFPIFAKEIGYDFDVNGISVIFVGGKDNFEIFIKLLVGYKIPYIIVCDRDAVMEINVGDVPSIFRQLNNLNLIEIYDYEHISSKPKENIEGINKIKDDKFEEVCDIARKYRCNPLSSDFEGVLTSYNYINMIIEAKLEVGKSKPRIGRYIAEKIVETGKEIPSEFIEVINSLKEL